MNRAPQGFKYLALALLFSLTLGVCYLLFFFFAAKPAGCNLDFSVAGFARVISNKDGRVQRLVNNNNGPLNHAYRKLATQSETYSGTGVHGAFRATDGYVDGTLSHTNEFDQPFLDIDLSGEIPVLEVRVWNREGEFANRIVPFKIFLSRAPFRGTQTSFLDAERISLVSQEFTEVQPVYVWKLDKEVTAGHVRVQLKNKSFLHVYEVEVYDTHVADVYRFVPSYYQERSPPPVVPLTPSFAEFLSLAGLVHNLTNPVRVFNHNGHEITPEAYNQQLFAQTGMQELYISEGEDFVGDLRVCIVFLCTDGQGYNTNADYLSEVFSNLEILSANFFKQYQYTVIIFYAWQPVKVASNIKSFNTAFPYLNIRFVDVSRHFPPTLPQHLIDNKVDMSLYEKGSDCAPGNHWKLNYLHMGRFWSTKLWFEPILKEYDLVWRLDADATVDQPIAAHNNFLRHMWSKKKLFAYWCRFPDTPECDTGIKEAIETFAQKKGLQFKHREKIDNDTAYWGGFGVYATSFFCHNKDWLEYADYLDSLGGHYNHRWGEQNVFPISLSLFLEFDQLHWVKNTNLKIYHDHWPMDNCHGVRDLDIKYLIKK